MVRFRQVILFAAIICLTMGAAQRVIGQERPDADAESVEQKIALLERRVTELNDVLALMMENLANCAEENEALNNRAGERKPDEDVFTGEKLQLIENIQSSLDTETYLGFLSVLNIRQLNTLLGLVEEKTKSLSAGSENTDRLPLIKGADNQ